MNQICWKAEAQNLATISLTLTRTHMRAARNTAAAVKAACPYIGHPAQVAVEIREARFWWRWYCIFNNATTRGVQ